MVTNQHKIIMGVCMPRALKEHIDLIRGDVPRSRYISRILEQGLANKIVMDDQQQNQSGVQPRRNSADIASIVSTTGGDADD
ncbi:MAG TPA: hypothetical protein VJ729_03405 [Nitrososphaeraceae archaeon]|nr:hypothetical protein [Nitrososphaeraceae archaeon]